MGASQRYWRRTFWLSAILAVLLAASLAPWLTGPTDLVRLRNSLLYQPAPADAAWTPGNLPAGFRVDPAPPSPAFVDIVRANQLAVPDDDWATALQIGRHLLQKADATGTSGPIQRDLNQTYRRIVEHGDGYCGDYVDAFTALATAAGIFARSWAFSFDGFGGHGHIFNEIWDRQAQRWRMIDVFNNYYVVDAAERPLSALEFRDLLLRDEPVPWRAVAAQSRPGFIYPDKALKYYRRGMHQWYLWNGNNVFQNDQNPLVGLFANVSPSLAQLSAIAQGIYPGIRVVPDPENRAMQRKLYWLGWWVLGVAVCVPLLLLLALISLWRSRRSRTG